eukprot:64429-Prymnesium_polylepis.1
MSRARPATRESPLLPELTHQASSSLACSQEQASGCAGAAFDPWLQATALHVLQLTSNTVLRRPMPAAPPAAQLCAQAAEKSKPMPILMGPRQSTRTISTVSRVAPSAAPSRSSKGCPVKSWHPMP